jgi:hypothetical protein
MKLTIKQLSDGAGAIGKIATCQDLDAVVAYQIGMLALSVQPHVAMAQKQEAKLFREYGTQVGEGATSILRVDEDGPRFAEFSAKQAALHQVEIEINVKPLTIEQLRPARLTGLEFASVHWLIKTD